MYQCCFLKEKRRDYCRATAEEIKKKEKRSNFLIKYTSNTQVEKEKNSNYLNEFLLYIYCNNKRKKNDLR